MLGLKSYGLTNFVTLTANRVKEAEHDVEHILESNIGKSVKEDEKNIYINTKILMNCFSWPICLGLAIHLSYKVGCVTLEIGRKVNS